MNKRWMVAGLLIAVAVYSHGVEVTFPNADFDQTTVEVGPGGFDVPGSDVPGWMSYGPMVESGVGFEGASWCPYEKYSAFMKSGDGAYMLSSYTIQEGDCFKIEFYAKAWWIYNKSRWKVTLFYGENPSENTIGTYLTSRLFPGNKKSSWNQYRAAIAATPESVGHRLGILFESAGPPGTFANLDEVSVDAVNANTTPFVYVEGTPTGTLYADTVTILATVIEGASTVDATNTFLVLDGMTNRVPAKNVYRSKAPAITICYVARRLTPGEHVTKVVVAGDPDGTATWEWKFTVGEARDRSRPATLYVDLNSTNPIPPYLSWETAATNIQDALNETLNDDTVLVADGTYNLTPSLDVLRGTLKSVNGPSSTILKGNGKGRVIYLESRGPVLVDGFTVTGGITAGDHSHGSGILAMVRQPVTISNCIIEHNTSGSYGGGISVSAYKAGSSITATISHCIVRHNEAKLTGGGITFRLLATDTSSVTIENCLIYNNRAEAGMGGVGGVGDVEERSHMDIPKVVNCTIWGNEGYVWAGGVARCCVYNSIVYNNHADRSQDISECKSVFNTCSPRAPNNHGNIRAIPVFANIEQGDFRLLPDSPCIEAGDNQHVTQTTDLAGYPRLMDADRDGESVVDMGAYEYVVLPVEIDIRPRSGSNVINRRARGFLPVAILSTESFHVSDIDPGSIRLAEARPHRWILQDVDKDGDVDLLMAFKAGRLRLKPTSTQILLTGQTKDKQPFIGKSSIVLMDD